MPQDHTVHALEQAPIPENEDERVKELMSYDIINTLPEDEFDALTNLASRICNVPISLINFVSSEKQYTKSCTGITADTTPRSKSICQYTILTDELFEVNDLCEDSRFKDMYYVKDEPHLRYYAGVPLTSDNGFTIGSLCIMDYEPGEMTDDQLKDLKTLANEVMARLKLRKREKSLEEMNSFKNKLMKVVSHDIRSPLTGILGAAEYLEDGDMDEEDWPELAKIIQEGAGQIQHLIADLMDPELTEFGILKCEPEPVDINDIMEEITRTFRFSARSKKIHLSYSLENITPELLIDRNKFTRVLSNIISNAIKFTPKGGDVTVTCRFKERNDPEETGILITTIRDSGIGMSDEQLDRLFSEKKQGGRKGTENESSYGLGMLIVDKLCKICDATVEVDSKENEGTEFKIDWPVKPS